MMQEETAKVPRWTSHGVWTRHLVLVALSVCLSLIGGIGSGGGGGERGFRASAAPPDLTVGTASGRLIVPPNQTLEVEPNDALSQAQTVTTLSNVAGSAAASDPGFPIPGFPAEAEDVYRLITTGRVRITLIIAADDLSINDLDLLLMDSSGTLLDASEGLIATEVLEIPEAGDFLVGIRASAGASAYVLSLSSVEGLSSPQRETIPPGATFVPGDILVKRKPDKLGNRQQAASFAAAYGLTHTTSLPPGVDVLRVSLTHRALQHGGLDAKLRLPLGEENALKALTLDAIRRLRMDPEVEYAEPNLLRQPSRVPTDQFFNSQWHYELINLPEAWDTTVGSDTVIVAVIDTGVLANHPDLSTRLIGGFDFISDPLRANDGDGIEPNADDPGDDPQGASSSFHGTHVAGTVGAVTDNASGVAGVTWQTRVMPLRVLGVEGGTTADITQAIRYAAGLPNVSGTVPPERADIINMSLAGPGFSKTEQDAILAARAQGVIVIAAAGNENTSAFHSPASLEGVISVSAVDLNSAKAPYSNFGSGIDVAAPGGNTSVDRNGDGYADGVLSTVGTDEGEFTFRFYQGTSMAAPHVAGVVALMLAVNPSLTPDDIDRLLEGTHPSTTIPITRDLGQPGRDDMFGHGLIDAAAAVIVAGSIPGGPGPTPQGSVLAVSTTRLAFDNFISSLAFEVTNGGIGMLTITGITADVPWLTLMPVSGTAPLQVTATVDRTGLAEGWHTATISITSDATQGSPMATVGVEVQVGGNTLGNIGPVFVLVLERTTRATVAYVVTDATQNYAFTTPAVVPGTYIVVAGTDRDNNRVICEPEDACGLFPDVVTITAGQDTPGVNFVVGELVAPQSTAAAFGQLWGMPFVRLD
jgi:serine protease